MSLSTLPRDLVRKVCKKHILGPIDILALSSTSSFLRNVLWHDERLWQFLFKQKWFGFPQSDLKPDSSNNWRDLYSDIKRWNTATLSTTKVITQHSRGVTSLCLAPGFLFSGSHDNTINVYSRENLEVVVALKGHKYTIWALASDGHNLYSGSNDHTIRVWNVEGLLCTNILTEHESKIFGLEIKDNLLFSSGDKIVKVWDRHTHKPLHTLEGHTGGVNAISVVDNIFISGASDKMLRFWDIHTLECLSSIDTDGKILSLVATNNLIFTGHDTCMIKVWDARSHVQIATGAAHNWEVWQLALAGGYLFSGSFDHKITAWDIRASFKNIKTFTGHRSFIHALIADSFQLFSGSADKSIRVWSDSNDITPA
eukprot:Phypoly_transcript_06017.p1 GENE.Phypoly_transcript_06017~~Phypoly_transcript_06017.p1  ORF type:complete len:369 (+),score=18.19 Phypoly_transcript_06017:236-1342(+)